jgi:septum formation protein
MNSVHAPVILASQSPQRFALFSELKIPFTQVPADIDEQAIVNDDLVKRAEMIATAKAEKIAGQHPDAIILAADTYIIFNGKALEKPKTEDEARAMLRQQSGQHFTEVSGLCYIDPIKQFKVAKTVSVDVWFRDLSDAEIETYVISNPVMTFSGAFCPAYASGAALIDRISGSFTSFTHGFPIEEFVPLLQRSEVI